MDKEEQLLEETQKITIEEPKSLNELFGLDFKENGDWTATNMNSTNVYRRLNRHERRQQKAIERKKWQK